MPDPAGRTVTLNGHILADRDWSTRTRRFCSVCLAEDVEAARSNNVQPHWIIFHRSLWDVTAMRSCPKHNCALSDECWLCGTKQGWRYTNLGRCFHCMADLTIKRSEGLNCPLDAFLASRVIGREQRTSIFDSLPIRDCLQLCMRLGQAKIARFGHALPRQKREMILHARDVGFAIAQDLVPEFRKVLDALVSARSVEAPDGLLGAYGWIYSEWLAGADPTAAIVRPILYKHAVQHRLMAADEPRVGNFPPVTMSIKQVRDEWGLGFEQTRKLLEQAGAIPPGSRRGVAFTICPEIVYRTATGRPRRMSVKATAKRLGTGAKQVRDLLSAKLLNLSEEGDMCVSQLELFERCLNNRASLSPSPLGAVTIGKAARANAVPLHEICDAIIAGTISCWRRDGAGLSAFNVQGSEVRNLRQTKADLSIEQASKVLLLHSDCVRALHRDGIISGPGAKVSCESVAIFKQRFISGSQWAKSVGANPRTAMQILGKEGIKPAFEIQKYRQSIFTRFELAKLTIK